jgi:hypothetical protein
LPAAVISADLPPLLAAIAAVDAFLVAVVLYFIAVGLYQLSFHPLPLPEWLVVHDLDELEDKLARVVVVVLGVAFLGQAVTWDGQRELLGFGVATAPVIAALAFHLRRAPAARPSARRHPSTRDESAGGSARDHPAASASISSRRPKATRRLQRLTSLESVTSQTSPSGTEVASI